MTMMKCFLRTLSLALLSLLLIYAPELLTAVSAPYQQPAQPRLLLRIALCTEDEQSVSSLYTALRAYQKAHPAIHLRVTRADAQTLLAPDDPAPALLLFAEACAGDAPAPSLTYRPAQGAPLLCHVHPRGAHPQAAQQLLDHLRSVSEAPPAQF